MLRIENLSAWYGEAQVLREASLTVNAVRRSPWSGATAPASPRCCVRSWDCTVGSPCPAASSRCSPWPGCCVWAPVFCFYYAALPIVLLGLFIAWRIVHSPFGRVLVGIRDNPARARAIGYPVHRYKLTAFVLSAFVAGLGGGLFVMGHRFASLDVLHWTTSGKAVIVVVLGGIGTLWGGVLGAALLVRLEDWLSFSGFGAVSLVTGGLFVLVVLLFRRGIWGTASALAHRWLWSRRR